jgi:N-acetylglucosaminyldiphosphoundecaprenol N-acetyl-beta-D-mannosaminyltransferase
MGTGFVQARPAAGNASNPMTVSPKRVDVLGVPVDCVDMSQSIALVDRMITGDRPATIVAVNPEKVMKARSDGALRRFLWNSGLLIPDGIGVVFAVRLLDHEPIERVPGAELMPAICARAAPKGYSVFRFGAAENVNATAADVLLRTYPGLRIVGRHHGYVTDEGMPAVIETINACRPDVLFVALGSPRQEIWFDRYLPQLKVKVCQGVGGTFDVIAGRIKRAPTFFRRNNLEWLYRLMREPRRAIRQAALPGFIYLLARKKFFGLDTPPGSARDQTS